MIGFVSYIVVEVWQGGMKTYVFGVYICRCNYVQLTKNLGLPNMLSFYSQSHVNLSTFTYKLGLDTSNGLCSTMSKVWHGLFVVHPP